MARLPLQMVHLPTEHQVHGVLRTALPRKSVVFFKFTTKECCYCVSSLCVWPDDLCFAASGDLPPVEDLDTQLSDLESEQRRHEGTREDIIRKQSRIKVLSASKLLKQSLHYYCIYHSAACRSRVDLDHAVYFLPQQQSKSK